METVKFVKTCCPACGSSDTKIYDCYKCGMILVRYHCCAECGERFKSTQNAYGRVVMDG